MITYFQRVYLPSPADTPELAKLALMLCDVCCWPIGAGMTVDLDRRESDGEAVKARHTRCVVRDLEAIYADGDRDEPTARYGDLQ